MAHKEGRPAWFKMLRNQKALIDAVPDKSAGRALKAIFSYFEDGKLPDDLEPLEFAVFSAVKPYVDDAYKDYARSVEAGRNGANTRWSK